MSPEQNSPETDGRQLDTQQTPQAEQLSTPPAPQYQPLPGQSAKPSVWYAATRPWRWLWAHLGFRARAWLIGMIVLMILGIGGILFGDAREQPTGTTSSKTSNSVSIDTYSGLAAACGNNGKAINGAAAYRPGSTPHSIVVFQQSDTGSTYTSILPAGLLTDPTVNRAVQPTSIGNTQLIACLDRTSTTSTGSTCLYQQVTLPIYSASYQLTIYEASTHRVVAREAVASTPLNDNTSGSTADNCPYITSYDPHNPRIYYPYSSSSLADAIRPSVQ